MILTIKDKYGSCLLLSCCLMFLTTRLSVEAAEENLRRGDTGGEKKDTNPAPPRGYPDLFSFDEKEALKAASLAARTGFVPTQRGDLELVSFNTGGQIFDGTKIQKYLESNFNFIGGGEWVSACDTNFETSTSKIELKMGLTARYNSLIGTFKANVGVEVGITSRLEKETVFCYQREGYHFGYLDLPFHHGDKSTLQALMDPIALSSLQGISSLSEAENLVETYGVGYFHRTCYGAVFKLSTKIEKQASFDSSDVEIALGASYSNFKGDLVEGRFSSRVLNIKTGDKNSLTVEHSALGGDPLLLNDISAWRESTRSSPVVTTFTVLPLYELLSPTNDSIARGFLETAVNAFNINYKALIPELQPLPWVPLDWNQGVIKTTNWFSEERGGLSELANGPIFSMYCNGRFCNNKQFQYMVYRNTIDIFGEPGQWSGWFSEEDGGFTCAPGKVVRRIHCQGRFCNNMRFLCAGLKPEFRVNNAATSTSDEFSGRKESVRHHCGPRTNKDPQWQSHYVIGIGCRGRFCGIIHLKCALIEGRGLSSSFSIENEPSLEALPEDVIA